MRPYERILHVMLQDEEHPNRHTELDNLFDALLTVPIEHHEVHEGDAFVCDYVDTAMGNGDTIIFAFKTIAEATPQKRVHMTLEFQVEVSGHLELFEAPTWTTGTGSQIEIHNRRREKSPTPMKSSGILEDTTSTFTATDNLCLNPTGFVAGSGHLHHVHSFGSKQSSPGASRGVTEWVLAPETQYALVLTSDATNNQGQIIVDWYEHTDTTYGE